MKAPQLLVFCLMLLFIPLLTPCAPAGNVPPNALLLVTAKIKEHDDGQKWVIDSLIRYMISESGRGKEAEKVREIRLFRFSDISFALLPGGPDREARMLITARLLPPSRPLGVTYDDRKFQLTIRDKKKAESFQKDLLHVILGIVCGVPAGSEPDGGVYYSPEGEARERISAFYVGGDVAMMASNRGIVKAALQEKSGLRSSATYRETAGLLPRGWDVYGYARSGGISLSSSPARRWQRFIFTLLKGAKRLALALDVRDRNESSLALALAVDEPGGAGELRERLEPHLEAMIKEFLNEEIRSDIRFEETPRALVVNARLSNTYPFWRDIFHLEPRGEGGRGKGSGDDK